MTRPPSLGAAACAFVLAGCQALNAPPPVDIAQPTSVRPLPVVAPVVNNGAIFPYPQRHPGAAMESDGSTPGHTPRSA